MIKIEDLNYKYGIGKIEIIVSLSDIDISYFFVDYTLPNHELSVPYSIREFSVGSEIYNDLENFEHFLKKGVD